MVVFSELYQLCFTDKAKLPTDYLWLLHVHAHLPTQYWIFSFFYWVTKHSKTWCCTVIQRTFKINKTSSHVYVADIGIIESNPFCHLQERIGKAFPTHLESKLLANHSKYKFDFTQVFVFTMFCSFLERNIVSSSSLS